MLSAVGAVPSRSGLPPVEDKNVSFTVLLWSLL